MTLVIAAVVAFVIVTGLCAAWYAVAWGDLP